MMTYDIRDFFPHFLTEDPTGYAMCKALEAGMNDFLAIVEQGVKMIDDASAMPEWRLDEVAWELGLPFNYKAEVEAKRAWIAEALKKTVRLGTVEAVKQYANGIFGKATIEENWQYSGSVYHYRVTANSQTRQANAEELFREAMRKAANARSVLDTIAYSVFGSAKLKLAARGSYVQKTSGESVWSTRNLIRGTLKPTSDTRPSINGKMQCRVNLGVSTVEHGYKSTKTSGGFSFTPPGIIFENGIDMCGLVAGTAYTLSYDAEMLFVGSYPDDTPYHLYVIVVYQTQKDGITETASQYIDTGIIYRHGEVCTGLAQATFALPHNTTAVNTINISALDTNDITGAFSMVEGDYIAAKNMKLENNLRATAWSAAPEDYTVIAKPDNGSGKVTSGESTLSITGAWPGVAPQKIFLFVPNGAFLMTTILKFADGSQTLAEYILDMTQLPEHIYMVSQYGGVIVIEDGKTVKCGQSVDAANTVLFELADPILQPQANFSATVTGTNYNVKVGMYYLA